MKTTIRALLCVSQNISTLLKHQRKHRSFLVTFSQLQRTIMQSHDLTGKTQSDAGAFLLCREERNKDLILALTTDRKSVIGNTDDCLF